MNMLNLKWLKITGLCVLTLGLCLGVAQINKKAVYQTRSEEFFVKLMETRVNAAYDQLLVGSPIKDKSSTVQNLVDKTSEALIAYGKPISVEFIKQQNYGDSIVRLVYILKYERAPLVWEFFFYQATPKSDWSLINLRFNDEPDLLSDH
jgi:hypothetical protein